MELDVVANRKFVVTFINDFLLIDDFVYFDDSNYRDDGIRYGEQLGEEYLDINKDFLIHIGEKEDFYNKIKHLKSAAYKEDKYDFIYLINMRSKGEFKVTETHFIWTPTKSDSAKKIGKMLKKEIQNVCNVGMEVVDNKYSGYNKYLQKFYWPAEVITYKDFLCSPVNVQIMPILDKMDTY